MTALDDRRTQPPILYVEIETRADVAEVRLRGEMDLSTRGDVKAALADTNLDGASLVRLDLRELGFCDASGVAELLDVRESVSREGRRLVADGALSQVRRVLDLVGLSTLLLGDDPDAPPLGGAAPEGAARVRAAAYLE